MRGSVSVVYNVADYFSFLLEMVLYAEPYDLIICYMFWGQNKKITPPFF